MRTITVEEIDIIVQASVEQALTEFKKLVPQIKKTIKEAESAFSQLSDTNAVKDIKEQFNSIDTKKIKSEVKQAAKVIQTEYGKAFKGTEKQQELLYEKIRQKREQLANLKTNGILNEGSDEEITAKVNAKFKETGKTPEVIDKIQILELEAEIEKLENRLISLQEASNKINMSQVVEEVQKVEEQIEDAFDPDDMSGMTINMGSFQSASKEITGIANNIKSYKAELGTLGQAYDNLRAKMAQATSETDSNVASNTKSVSEYEQKLNELYNKWGQGKVSLGEIQQFKANNSQQVSNQQVSAEPSQSSLTLWDTLKQKIEQARATIEQFKQSLGSGGNSKQLELVKYQISEIEEKLQQAKAGDIHLNTGEIVKAEAELERLNNKKTQLEQEGKGNAFSNMSSGIKKVSAGIKQVLPNINSMKNKFSQIPKSTQKITNSIKQMGKNLKTGLSSVLKYVAALFSLRTIYSTLSSAASSWLSSQNSAAQQLSANIDYMKYAMGSAFAPVIEYVINLVYKLMKAIQSVVYALTGVNIFANASAKSYAEMADSAEDANEATKQLAGVHSEINNISSSDSSSSSSSSSPSFDLSTIEDTSSSILDAIANGDWYAVGAEIGKKINEALDSIDWASIQSKAQEIATNIGDFINGFVDGLDWNLLGTTIGEGINTAFIFANTLLTTINWGNIGTSIANFLNSGISTINWSLIGETFANGLNAIINMGFNFVTTFDWGSLGTAISTGINSLFLGVEWDKLGTALGTGIRGIFTSLKSIFDNTDWSGIASKMTTGLNDLVSSIHFDEIGSSLASGLNAVIDFLHTAVTEFDWIGLATDFANGINNFVTETDWGELGQTLSDGLKGLHSSILEAIKTIDWGQIGSSIMDFILNIDWLGLLASSAEIGINLVAGLLEGIVGALATIGEWLYEHLIQPIVDGVKSLFGINSPSTVFMEIGTYLIEGLKNGLSNIWEAIKSIFTNLVSSIKEKFTEIKENISTTVENIKTSITDKFNTIKEKISTIINNIKTTLSTIWNNIKTTITTVVSNIYNGIVDKFNAVKTKISSILSSIKTTFSNVFNTIWSTIKSVVNSILSGIETMVNSFIKVVGKIVDAVKTVASYVGINISFSVSEISLPRLAKGAVLTVPTIAEMAEYPGASTNPEIVTPQDIMKETFEDVLSRYQDNNDSSQPIYLTVNVGNEKLGQILLDDLRSMKRRSGKGIEALVGN